MEIEVTGNLLFVNVGELSESFLKNWFPKPDPKRNWENSRDNNFISAGQNIKSRNQICKINKGDILCTYVNELGFVGIGVCLETAIGYDKSFVRDLIFTNPTNLQLNYGDQDLQEYVIKTIWFKETLRNRNNAEMYGSGITSHIVCNLSDAKKEFIEERFNVKFLRQ